MMGIKQVAKKDSRGFTIVELMISTMVFSVIVVIVSGVIVRLSQQYYGGLSRSRTQEVARTIAEEIAKGIQYSRDTPTEAVSTDPAVSGWCIGANSYAYVLGQKVSSANGGLVRSSGCDTITGPPSVAPGSGNVQMLADNMRLSNLEINKDPSNEYFEVVVRVALGDDDQLTNPTDTDANCKLDAGRQFCAASEYKIIVVRRL